MMKSWLRQVRVGAPLFAVAIALIVFYPHERSYIVLSLVAVILLLVALASGITRWRNPQMDPEHAKRMQAIARYLDSMILANNINLSFNDGQTSSTINETCFRADFSSLDPLLRVWVTMPHESDREPKTLRR